MSAPTAEANTWLIKRNCSAGPRQLAVVFGSLVAVSFAFGLGFAAFGLWMVLPFVGLELIAVGAAFFCYGWHAADFDALRSSHRSCGRACRGRAGPSVGFDPRVSHVEVETPGRRWGQRVRVFLLAPATRLELGR